MKFTSTLQIVGLRKKPLPPQKGEVEEEGTKEREEQEMKMRDAREAKESGKCRCQPTRA